MLCTYIHVYIQYVMCVLFCKKEEEVEIGRSKEIRTRRIEKKRKSIRKNSTYNNRRDEKRRVFKDMIIKGYHYHNRGVKR